MPRIIIDKSLCTKCNICSTLCEMIIIDKEAGSGYPTIPEEKIDNCFKCGHCEAFCPQKALTLDFLTGEKITINDTEGRIDPQNLSVYLKKRRSVRHFTSQTVSRELISAILDVCRYAASGGNAQPVKWIVVQNSSEVRRVAELTIEWMRSIQHTSHPLSDYAPGIISAWDNGSDPICRNAPHLLIAHIPVEAIDDPTDAIIALTHFDIAAPSFGIGTCWAGFIKLAMDNYTPLRDFLSIPEGRNAACPIMFGYSKFKSITIPRRNPVDISWK
jgi:nitroreductase/NAD-dependent dihydropyrimidine dehydrogenase PreA subunit